MFLVQALTKVPTNVQHFAELGVYKQMRKKEKEMVMFPHLPHQVASFPLVSDAHPESESLQPRLSVEIIKFHLRDENWGWIHIDFTRIWIQLFK
jgi:hypothetical protein